MRFTWRAEKAQSNFAKHGVEFESAKAVFQDPHAMLEINDGEPTEERWRTIGMAEGSVLFVVHTEVEDDVIHIISARRANKREQDRYYRQAFPQG